MSETLQFEQLLYGWSDANYFGQRGFGVVAASSGWRAMLQRGDSILGPVIAYPEPGPGGSQPPRHGGFAVLGDTPVMFRRVPNGTDALRRPGNFTVHVLMGRTEPLTAHLAAALLDGDWPAAPLPDQRPELPILELPTPGPRRGRANTDPLACGAVLQGLRDGRRVVIGAGTEPEGRAALCDALRRLPPQLSEAVTFCTLEADPQRSDFDLAVVVDGWGGGSRAPSGSLVVDLAGDRNDLDPACRRWGRALATATAASLRGLPEPVTVDVLGERLDGLELLRTDPRGLTAAQLASVLTSPDGSSWAAQPAAAGVASDIVAAMDPAVAPRLARAAVRRPAVASLLKAAGWAVVSGTSGSDRAGAASLLVALGEDRTDIDLELLASSPAAHLSPKDSARHLGQLAGKGRRLDQKIAAKITWDEALAAAHPQMWFEAVALSRYRGPRATAAILEGLTPAGIREVLLEGKRSDPTCGTMAHRLSAVLPSGRADQVRYLRLIAAAGEPGLRVAADHLLAMPGLDPKVRSAVLERVWPEVVRAAELPDYLADAMRPAGRSADSAARTGLLAVSLLLVLVLAWEGFRLLG